MLISIKILTALNAVYCNVKSGPKLLRSCANALKKPSYPLEWHVHIENFHLAVIAIPLLKAVSPRMWDMSSVNNLCKTMAANLYVEFPAISSTDYIRSKLTIYE